MEFSESLKKNQDFKTVYGHGKSCANRYLVMFHFTPNLSLERAILRELSLNRTLMKKDLDRLKETHQGNSIQVAQCILRYKLSYRPVPMLVWKTKEALFCPVLQRRGEEETNDRILEQNTF